MTSIMDIDADQRIADRWEQLQRGYKQRKFEREAAFRIKQASISKPSAPKQSTYELEDQLSLIDQQLTDTIRTKEALEQDQYQPQQQQQEQQPQKPEFITLRAFSTGGGFNERDKTWDHITHYDLTLQRVDQISTIDNAELKNAGTEKGRLLIVTAKKRYPTDKNKPYAQFNASTGAGLEKYSNDINQKILLPIRLAIKRDRVRNTEHDTGQLIRQGIPAIIEGSPQLREICKVWGYDDRLLHPVRIENNEAIANASKLVEGARELQSFIPVECSRNCSLCYESIQYDSIKDWSSAR